MAPPAISISDDDESTMLSRSGRSNAGGKLDRRLDIPLSEELEAGITTLAMLADVPRAEYARQVLASHVFGELGMAQRVTRLGRRCPSDDYPINRG